MKLYEALIVFPSQGASELLQGGKSIFEEAVKKHEGKILNRGELGKRVTGYSLKKAKEGYFVSFVFELPPEKMDSLKRSLKLTEDILKFTIIKRSKVRQLLRSRPVQSQIVTAAEKR